jgi:aryl-alcohol dehydrogenase-like predicted oxidoreductase
MEHRRLASLDVTTVGIGCNNFGRELDQDATTTVVHAAIDAGVTFFDTADAYGRPRTLSEQYLGNALAGRRDQAVIATKVGSYLDDEHRGARPAYIKQAVENSLRRLRTDRVDLMQLHRPDPYTPVADTLGAFGELVDEGKILEIGCSNFDAEQLRDAAAAVPAGRPGFASVQNEYSILNRSPELDPLPECRRSGIAFLPYFPLFNGLLTGKYRRGHDPSASYRLANRSAEIVELIFTEENFDRVDALTEFAHARGHTLLELAFAWLLAQPGVPSVIAGVTSPAQVRANAAATGWALTAEDLAEVDRIAPPPAEVWSSAGPLPFPPAPQPTA